MNYINLPRDIKDHIAEFIMISKHDVIQNKKILLLELHFKTNVLNQIKNL